MQIKSDYFGKYCEHKIFAELLRHHFDVFTTIVDNKGIDCVVRKNENQYLDLQIKGRQPRWIYNIGTFHPRKNYFFIFITPDEKIYIVPSLVISELVDSRWKIHFPKVEVRRNTMLEKYEYKEGQDFVKLLNF